MNPPDRDAAQYDLEQARNSLRDHHGEAMDALRRIFGLDQYREGSETE